MVFWKLNRVIEQNNLGGSALTHTFINKIKQIYNTLYAIKTSGNDTILLANCLVELNLLLDQMQKSLEENTNESTGDQNG